MSFEIVRKVVQKVPAWTEETGWHEAVVWSVGDPAIVVSGAYRYLAPPSKNAEARSTILFQLYDPCGECGGKGWTGPRAGYCGDICPFCLKDSDGSPTGAAEGTGQGWKVEV